MTMTVRMILNNFYLNLHLYTSIASKHHAATMTVRFTLTCDTTHDWLLNLLLMGHVLSHYNKYLCAQQWLHSHAL